MYGIGESGREFTVVQKEGSARMREIVDLEAELRCGETGLGMRAVCGL